ncbi:hypothetical protein F5ESL0260_07715 [Lactobacillus sp. ESL0260]|uniref:hypothetical protein n=1 Tax=Lactobacillus sp. ESL0260 TaxID=2069347 RepID=UPI000EFC57C1|nr:hypothetical protein [Lactobacillus sp. ESL0260]RMC56416.1 hypothetical protein F5ESL0260_07715 [Lactobacillus sp. ESL0260]
MPKETTGENKRLHLKMVEDTITRMSSNSFLIKGWSLTAIGGLVTLYLANINEKWACNILYLCLFATILFWISDAYYLCQERRYRSLYDEVAKKDEADIDFSMKPNSNETMFKCMFRPIFLRSYLIILLALIVLIKVSK